MIGARKHSFVVSSQGSSNNGSRKHSQVERVVTDAHRAQINAFDRFTRPLSVIFPLALMVNASSFRGTFIDTPSLGELAIYYGYTLSYNSEGYITYFGPSVNASVDANQQDEIPPGSFLFPTFTDLHLHAPQYLYQGNGLDLPLMQWLDAYTYAAEDKLDSDPILARKVYTSLAKRLVKNGTGAISFFGTIKTDTKYADLPLCLCLV